MEAAVTPRRPVVDVKAWARAHWWLVAAVLVVAGVLGVRQLGHHAPAAAETVMVEKEPTTTTTTPRLDPMAGFSKPLSPLAMALVGGAYDDRRELARRVNELLGQGLGDCAVFLGSDGVSWSVSAVWSAAYPSPVFAGCPWPPPSTTTAAAPK